MGEGVLRFSVEKFLSHWTETKNFVGEPFGVSENFWYRKTLWIGGRGGSITIFWQKFFVSQRRKIHREPFCVSENFWYRKILWLIGGGRGRRRESHDFPAKIFCLTVPKNFAGEPFNVSENFWCIKPCCLTHCAMVTIGISDKCQWNHKNIWHDRDSKTDLLLETLLS